MENVKKRRRGTRISEKHQVTIPIDAMRIAGLEAGERVVARADGPGRVVLEREEDVLESFSGLMTAYSNTESSSNFVTNGTNRHRRRYSHWIL